MGRTPGISEPHFTSRDRQIRNCVMIHRTTTAMISIAIDQVMTVIAPHRRGYSRYGRSAAMDATPPCFPGAAAIQRERLRVTDFSGVTLAVSRAPAPAPRPRRFGRCAGPRPGVAGGAALCGRERAEFLVSALILLRLLGIAVGRSAGGTRHI